MAEIVAVVKGSSGSYLLQKSTKKSCCGERRLQGGHHWKPAYSRYNVGDIEGYISENHGVFYDDYGVYDGAMVEFDGGIVSWGILWWKSGLLS